jgi:hypothetical protein
MWIELSCRSICCVNAACDWRATAVRFVCLQYCDNHSGGYSSTPTQSDNDEKRLMGGFRILECIWTCVVYISMFYARSEPNVHRHIVLKNVQDIKHDYASHDSSQAPSSGGRQCLVIRRLPAKVAKKCRIVKKRRTISSSLENVFR